MTPEKDSKALSIIQPSSQESALTPVQIQEAVTQAFTAKKVDVYLLPLILQASLTVKRAIFSETLQQLNQLMVESKIKKTSFHRRFSEVLRLDDSKDARGTRDSGAIREILETWLYSEVPAEQQLAVSLLREISVEATSRLGRVDINICSAKKLASYLRLSANDVVGYVKADERYRKKEKKYRLREQGLSSFSMAACDDFNQLLGVLLNREEHHTAESFVEDVLADIAQAGQRYFLIALHIAMYRGYDAACEFAEEYFPDLDEEDIDWPFIAHELQELDGDTLPLRTADDDDLYE